MTVTAPSRLLVGGQWIDGGGGGYDIVNPADGTVVAEAPEASVDDALAAAAAARAALPSWSALPVEERAALLDRVGAMLLERRDDLYPLVQAETGSTTRVAKAMQISQAGLRLRDNAAAIVRHAREWPVPVRETPTTALAPGGLVSAVAVQQPMGVVACITSYNFPLTNMTGKIGPALAMGNTVVIKPAPQDPLAVIALLEMMEEAGFPPGVANIISSTDPAPAEALVAAPDVDMISFTGSTAVGCRIAEVAGSGMKRLLLELGGKGASIIFDDADLDAAVSGTGSTWAFHAGQVCSAPTRVIAQRGVYDQVVERLAAFAGFLKVGDPTERETMVGPVITAAHHERIRGYIASGLEAGARAVVGPDTPVPDQGCYVAPHLLADARPDMRIVQEEIFGPVIVALPVDDEEEAVAVANSTDFGLYDYVWSGDAARAARVARQLRTGNVGLNTVQRNQDAPFGGFKKSGVGRDGGEYGFAAYSELQSIVWST